ncbi:Flagellar hook-associated protein 2 [Paraliobacillus sp. PM-2]|uniref:flagellar filament capping protein FliD n=1 Tax=Paraliobacillus sp. PM-2 TaxID=1462524 RepID=UPI00061C0D67|nr:flagellar filament capping protein FliD [Paraliobacillus sp. PM-2]CQR46406.1 Flagellar hook-associated protein 2 [Paraliobacillus sp. PM-2]
MAYSVNTSNRITGLASGIDTESMVKELMAAERKPLDKMEQDQIWTSWRRDAYRDMNKLFYDLDQQILDMKLQRTYNGKSVTSTNDTLVTATASASSSSISHTIEDVTIATAARNVSQSSLSTDAGDKIDPSQSLWMNQGKFSNGITWETETYTNEDITVSQETATFKLAKGALNEASLGGKTIDVADSDGNLTSYDIVAGSTADLDTATIGANQVFVNVDDGTLKFGSKLSAGSTIKGQDYDHQVINFSITTFDQDGNPINDSSNADGDFDFSFDGTTTMNQMLNKITNSNVGVSAFYDEHNDVVSLQRTETGDLNNGNAGMAFSGSFLTDTLQLNEANEIKGTDATFTIDGLTTKRHSNTFTISDVTYTLNKSFNSEPVQVNVQNDVETSFDKIKSFVENYNTMIEKVNEAVQETRYRDYKPLTDTQKKELSEKEIELWEEKSKSGLLKGDSILSNGLSNMRSNWYANVDNSSNFSSLIEVGITTSSDYTDRGKLEIDEDKLKAALREDPDSVHKLFSNNVEGSGRGIMNRLEDSIEGTINRVEERAGKASSTPQQYTLGRQLDQMDDQISDFEDRLVQTENRYWRQFTQMEKMIQQMNSQSNYLMQQFSG